MSINLTIDGSWVLALSAQGHEIITSNKCSLGISTISKKIVAGRTLIYAWCINSFIMVVYENFLFSHALGRKS